MRSSVRARSGCLRISPGLIRRAVLRELRQRRRVLLEVVGRASARASAPARRSPRSRRAPARPPARTRSFHGLLPSCLPRQVQAGDRAGHADRAVAVVMELSSRTCRPPATSSGSSRPAPPRGSRTSSRRRSAARKTRKPPPPMLPAVGCVTASANAVATAASTALPPSRMTWKPTSEAMSLCDTTIALRARAGWLPASSESVSVATSSATTGANDAAVMHRMTPGHATTIGEPAQAVKTVLEARPLRRRSSAARR